MGVSCCNRAEDQYQLDSNNSKIMFPLNSYIKDSINVPEEWQSVVEEKPVIKPTIVPEAAVHCRVYACYDENIFPIWVDVGSTLQFYVLGNWYLFDGMRKVGSEGDTENQSIMNFPLGSLLGHVQGGSLFEINNKSKYYSKKSGYLMMLQNNGSYETNPFGYIDVFVLGGKIYKWNEIERLSGWNYNMIDTGVGAYYLGEKEKDLLVLLNKLRYNPSKFAEKYLSHLSGMSSYYEETFRALSRIGFNPDQSDGFSVSSTIESSSLLKPEYKLYKIAEKHGKDLNSTGNVGHISIEGLKLDERLRSFDIDSDCYSEVCSFGKACPIGILLQLLVDDDEIDNSQNRDTLIFGNFSHAGISIQRHKTYGFSCIITLVKL